MAHIIKENIAKIIGLPGNNKCGDCGVEVNTNNGWASMTFGTIICVECAGAHRNIPGNQIRSFLLDTNAWTSDKNVNFLSKIGGNTSANNNVWECHLPYYIMNPKREYLDEFGDRDRATKFRHLFVQNKYEKQLYIPLSQSDYFTSKNHSIIKVPLDPIKQKLIYLYNIYGKKKWSKKPLYICIHSNYLSIYGNHKIKKKKCDHVKSYNLIPLSIAIHLTDPYDDDDEFYEFQIINDKTFEDEKEEVDDDDDEIEPVLRARVKDFDLFCDIVHELRKSIQYYRMYSTLVSVNDIETNPSCDEGIYNNQLKQSKQSVGCGKIFGGSSWYFYVVSDTLYAFTEDPLLATKALLKAQNAWNLQKIDLLQDPDGDRTGIKNSVMIIEPFKLITIKFETERKAIVFFHKLRKLWRNVRGSYLVDFKPQMPVILDENKEKDDQMARNPRLDRLDFSRVKSTALKKQRPPEILEILAKIENIEVEELPEEEEEDEEEDDMPLHAQSVPQQSVPLKSSSEVQNQWAKMQELHRKMSSPALHAQKAPSIAPSLPKLGEPQAQAAGPGLPPPVPQMQMMDLGAPAAAKQQRAKSVSPPPAPQISVAKLSNVAEKNGGVRGAALNSYQQARMRQRRKRKQTAPANMNPSVPQKQGGPKPRYQGPKTMDANVNKAFLQGLKKGKGMFAMRKREEKSNKKPLIQQLKHKPPPAAGPPPPNPIQLQIENQKAQKKRKSERHVQGQLSQDMVRQKQKQKARDIRGRNGKYARSMDYGNLKNEVQPPPAQPMHAQINSVQLQPQKRPQKQQAAVNSWPPKVQLMQSRSSDAKPFDMKDPSLLAKRQQQHRNKVNKNKTAKWSCGLCTYNNEISDAKCSMCGGKRPGGVSPVVKQQQPQSAPVAEGGVRDTGSLSPVLRQQNAFNGYNNNNNGRASGLHSMSMSGPVNVPPNMFGMQQQQQQQQDPMMLMLFHQQQFQKFFQQQQVLQQTMNPQQLQQTVQTANYHYQQYMVLYQQYQQKAPLQQQMPPQQHAPQNNNRNSFVQQQQQQYQMQQKQQMAQRRRKPKRRKKAQNTNTLLQKRKAGVQMQYIKLERYFVMNENQQNYLAVNLFAVQQSLGHIARLDVVADIGCYKVRIPSNIPLPRRKAHWQNILKKVRESIGMSMEHIA